MSYTVEFEGNANLKVKDLTITGNTYLSNVVVDASPDFQSVTASGNTSTQSIQITSTEASTSELTGAIQVAGGVGVQGNVYVGSNLFVTSNLEVDTDTLFVDAVSGNVGIGVTDPGHKLDIVSEMNLRSVSNTASVKYNSNVVTEYTRSKKFIKYPRVLLTYDAQDSQGGYENYIVDQSSVYTSESDHGAYLSFRNVGNYWLSSSTSFGGGDDVFNGTNGPWISIQLPNKIKLEYLEFYHRSGITNQKVTAGSVYASNDGTNWTEIGSLSGLGTYDTTSVPARVNFTHATLYDRYLLHVTANETNYVSMERLSFYGIPEYDPEAHGTDVIMRSVPNVPNTDWLEVYYDGQDYTQASDFAGTDGVVDKAGGDQDGTPNGGVGFDTEYKAFTFDGGNITGDSNSTAGNWIHTMSTWIYFNSLVTNKVFGVNPNSYVYSGHNETSTFYARSSGFIWDFGMQNNNTTTLKPVTNRWYHVTLVADGSGYKKIYIDSELQTSFSYSNNTNIVMQTNAPLNIGEGNLDGSIANFRLFNRALTADEVWQLYAYQKEYFDVSPDVVTFKGGRLGIGTSEPRAVLDVKGDFHAHGSVVQFQSRTFGLSFATTSTTFTDTGAYVDITPKFSNSKFFVMFDGLAQIDSSASGLGIRGYRSIGGADQLVYSCTTVPGGNAVGHDLAFYSDPGAYGHARISISFGDTPNTSSSIRYKIYGRAHVSGRSVRLGNVGNQPVTFSVFEIAQ